MESRLRIDPQTTLADLIRWAEDHGRSVAVARGLTNSPRELILYQATKITEEVGELAKELLTGLGLARSEKRDSSVKPRVGEELADVLIATLVLGAVMKIDVLSELAAGATRHDNRAAQSYFPSPQAHD